MSSVGPNSPSTVTTSNVVGTVDWSNPTNAISTNNSYAIASLNASSIHQCRDVGVYIIKSDGTLGSENKADTANNWPLTDTYKSYGGSTDLWSESWAYTDINDTDFGVVISAKDTTTNVTSYYLKATNFGFSISSGNTIGGILVEIERKVYQGSLAKGTKITTPDGQINIEDVVVGQKILTLYRGKVVSDVVVKTFQSKKPVIELKTKNGLLLITESHLINVSGKWKKAKNVKVGDYLLKFDGKRIKKQKIISINQLPEIDVYNLTTKKSHTYFGNNFLVHNLSGGGSCQAFIDHIRITITYSAAASAIKTINGLAKASVKTINGLAIASVKTVNGLA